MQPYILVITTGNTVSLTHAPFYYWERILKRLLHRFVDWPTETASTNWRRGAFFTAAGGRYLISL